jgi:hypothetical protein
MVICRRISNVGRESSSLLPHGVVLCSGDWLWWPPRHPFDLCVRPWPTDVNGDLARDNTMTTSMTPIREGAVEFVNKHGGAGHAIGRGRGVARAVCSHRLVAHSTLATILSISCAFLLASPSSTTTCDLVADAIAVAFLIEEGTLKKLEC